MRIFLISCQHLLSPYYVPGTVSTALPLGSHFIIFLFHFIFLMMIQSLHDHLYFIHEEIRHRDLSLIEFIQPVSRELWLGSLALPVCLSAKSFQLCLILCNPMDYSPPVSSVHRLLQAKILEWIAIPLSRGSSRSKNWTHVSSVSCFGMQILCHQHHLGSPPRLPSYLPAQ